MLKKYADVLKPISVDEAYIDCSGFVWGRIGGGGDEMLEEEVERVMSMIRAGILFI